MKISPEKSLGAETKSPHPRCNHPLAVLIDPTPVQLRELEAMLCGCPNCSRWMPGDGPIMAVISTDVESLSQEPIRLSFE
jgi:hypothetical protein